LGSEAISIIQSGYVYIYTSNESSVAAFFDNLAVNHITGPLIEETHYYPFGLTMAGISSKAAGKLESNRKFNDGTELTSDLGLEFYETPFRSYDAQLGRFHQVDPLGELTEGFGLYAFALDEPITNNDPLGLSPDAVNRRNDRIPNCGSQAITGWINDGNRIYFDPRVHSEVDVKKFGLNGSYVGERISLTASDGSKIWLNESGEILINNPNWDILPVVTVVASKKPSWVYSNAMLGLNLLEDAAHGIVSSMVYVGTAVGSSVYNAANGIIHEGIHDGAPYDFNLYSGRTFKLVDWRFTVVVDYSKGNGASTEELKELAMATVNTVSMPLQVVPGLKLTNSPIVNQVATSITNSAAKAVLKAPIKHILNQ